MGHRIALYIDKQVQSWVDKRSVTNIDKASILPPIKLAPRSAWRGFGQGRFQSRTVGIALATVQKKVTLNIDLPSTEAELF